MQRCRDLCVMFRVHQGDQFDQNGVRDVASKKENRRYNCVITQCKTLAITTDSD